MDVHNRAAKEHMKALIRDENIELVRIECEDTNGVSRGFNVDVDFFFSQIEDGIPITKSMFAFPVNCGCVLPDTGVTEEITFANGAMYPDISTFEVLPWEYNIASVLSDVRTQNGNPNSPFLPVSPRVICKRQLEKLHSLGIQLFSSFEFEFYLLCEETKLALTDDINCFATRSQSKFTPFVKDVVRAMKKLSIIPEVHHTECGPGQQEITCSPAFGIQGSDNAFRFRNLVKDIASKHKYLATFMSKPHEKEAGSSGHFNHSLWDLNGKSLMYDADKPYGISEIAGHWIAGLRYHSNALMGLASTTSNCFERLILEDIMFAPVNNSWGLDNRTVTYRIKNHQSPKLYVENRLPGAAVNPYLLVAGSLIAGMDGIERKLPLDVEPFKGVFGKETVVPDGVHPLPHTLPEAMKCLESDDVMVKELGPEFMKCFLATRREECRTVDEVRSSGDDLFKWYRDTYAEFL